MTGMRVDMRHHKEIREQVHAGISALRVQGRQIWGDGRLPLSKIVTRLMVGVGDLARLERDGGGVRDPDHIDDVEWANGCRELKKELGNIIFSTIRWIDDLGLDVLECLDLAIEAQEMPTTKDADGGMLRFLDAVESTERIGHRATVGPVYLDGTFDVCDADFGLFEHQRSAQWRRVFGPAKSGRTR